MLSEWAANSCVESVILALRVPASMSAPASELTRSTTLINRPIAERSTTLVQQTSSLTLSMASAGWLWIRTVLRCSQLHRSTCELDCDSYSCSDDKTMCQMTHTKKRSKTKKENGVEHSRTYHMYQRSQPQRNEEADMACRYVQISVVPSIAKRRPLLNESI